MTLLTVEGLRKSWGGVAAVRDVSLSLTAGEKLALIGPNGAGKSTLFNLIAGQIRPDAGRVLFDGRAITGLPPRRLAALGIGRSFQITGYFPSLTVREAVQTAIQAREKRWWNLWQPAARLYRDEAAALLDETGLEALADRPAAGLPYGDLKRVELALALAGRPRLMLMDEPTAGMAAGERAALMALVSALVRQRGLSVLFTEHDMDMVFGHADRLLVLARGSLIAAGTPQEVRADPQVRRLYLGETDA